MHWNTLVAGRRGDVLRRGVGRLTARMGRAGAFIALVTALLLPVSSQAGVMSVLTGGAWATYASARQAVDGVQMGVVLGGTLTKLPEGAAFIAGYAKVPGQPAGSFYDASMTRVLDDTVTRSSILLGTASASAGANPTTGVYGYGVAGNRLSRAAAAAGAGGKWGWRSTGAKAWLKCQLAEMTIDPIPIPSEDDPFTDEFIFVGEGVPAVQYMQFDIMLPGSTEYTTIHELLVEMVWDEGQSDYGLTITDSLGLLTPDDFEKSLMGVGTTFTLKQPKDLYVEMWATYDLTENGTPWEDGAEIGAQVWGLGEVAAVPEPTMLALLAVGIGVIKAHRRKAA